MKGLWTKDLLILMKQYKTYLLFMGIVLFNSYANRSVEFMFLMLGFCLVSLATATIFYDQENRGFTYIFSLPIKKGHYVLQKELLILAAAVVASLLSVILSLIMFQIDQGFVISAERMLFFMAVSFLLACLYGAIVIPLYLKFNTEQAKIVMMSMIGGFLAAGFLIEKTKVFHQLTQWQGSQFIATLTATQLSAVLMVFALILLWISGMISQKIID
ncbi:ABC-2 transporter permease [Enterococcus olivae]